MRKELAKSIERKQLIEIIYRAKDDVISKRRIIVLRLGDGSFSAYCYLRKSKRTFRIDNVLALVPVVSREKIVI